MVRKQTTIMNRAAGALLGLVLLLGMIPPTTVRAATNIDGGSGIIVSLGDSYSSGEGIEDFYGHDLPVEERVENKDFLAHRSENSWPGQLKINGESRVRDNNWYFVAASGALTKHLDDARQKKEYDIEGHSGYEYLNLQLDVFDELKRQGKEAEYVTVTIGGNDADFGDVVKKAATNIFEPDLLNQKLAEVWNEFYHGTSEEISIRERIRQAYYDIEAAAGKQAKIIVVGYPKLLCPKGSGVLFSESDAALINDSVTRFNQEIEAIVNSCKAEGMRICFVSVEEAFGDRGAYASDALINRAYMTRRDQDLVGGIYKSSYSIHPNKEGAKVYAECVNKKIEQIEADGGKSEWPTLARSDEREVALVLDASGSMDGTPMTQTKSAGERFVRTILEEQVSIGVVAYDSTAMRIADFCMNESYLVNTLQNLNAGGMTNMEAGLEKAYMMLQQGNAKKKMIVLMSDGMPNEGKTGQSLIDYAQSLKDQGIYIYTLGFFHNMGDREKVDAQALLEAIASAGCHFEVAGADDLAFFFTDIADQINGQKYYYIRIACPVDVTVKYNGEVLSSEEDDLSTRTSFGSLSFEESEEDEEGQDNRVKVLRLKEGVDYDIKIEGTGRGYMDYTIGFMDDEGQYSDMRKFTRIKINKKTVIDTVAQVSETTTLNVDEDGDGKYDLKYRADANGKGKLVDDSYILYIGFGVSGLLAVLIFGFMFKRRKKKINREKERRN